MSGVEQRRLSRERPPLGFSALEIAQTKVRFCIVFPYTFSDGKRPSIAFRVFKRAVIEKPTGLDSVARALIPETEERILPRVEFRGGSAIGCDLVRKLGLR